ncbi:MAG: universal stress protein [Ginsengibacter sp.]
MDNIIVPLDFSDASYNAAHYAASLSNIFNASIILVHTYMNPFAIDEMPADLLNQPEKELWEIKEEQLTEYVEILRKKFTIRVKGVVREGMPTPSILAVAANENAGLIVMGMKGKGKSNSVFGSNTTLVMRKSSIPVLVIPEKVEFKNIENITLASDFDVETELSNYSLLREIALKNNVFIRIVNVRKKNSGLSDDEIAGKLNTALAFEGLKHQFYMIKEDEVDEGIEDFLEEHPSDILVMVARKRNLFERIFKASHTKKMSYETEIPLLVLQDR